MEVLGDSVDLSTVRIRLRINKGKWQVIDTSTGKVIAVVAPAESGKNQLDFEVTDENGKTVVVQREILVEGTPEAAAYIAEDAATPTNETSRWPLAIVAMAIGVLLASLLLLWRRRRRDSSTV